jgi:hypothetical protein
MWWKRKDDAMEKLKAWDIIPLNFPGITKEQVQLDGIIKTCRPFIGPYVNGGNLLCVYLYDQEKQVYPLNQWIGVCTMFEDETAAIGIATGALSRGRDDATLTLLHEIAHLEHMEHDQDFKAHLDRLIDRFNQATGRRIVNDM